ncbi:MAG: hypothetical protein K6U12_00805 [Armatimonadetes bacterium]|nr:hypothetical protein [Armatimonadota bacterium]CUU37056.1 hypothetical protein DCOP10_119162 [Armatimonadetes bacterium DC]
MRKDEERYTPEEVQEILRIALQQRKDTFSVQEIESIGREVGIEPEAVHTAIERYRQIREEEQRLLEQERIARNRTAFSGSTPVTSSFLNPLSSRSHSPVRRKCIVFSRKHCVDNLKTLPQGGSGSWV